MAALLLGLKGTVKVSVCFRNPPRLDSPNHILPSALLASVQMLLALGDVRPQTPPAEESSPLGQGEAYLPQECPDSQPLGMF